MKLHSKLARLLLGIGVILAVCAIASMFFSPIFYNALYGAYAFQTQLPAGWYPRETASLNEKLEELDTNAAQRFSALVAPNSIRAMIVPHAGYAYSGDVAAAVYRLLQGSSIKNILILAPDHRASFEGVALPTFNTYEIPTGTLAIDTATIETLADKPLFSYNDAAYKPEHSIEMQLPFIHRYLPHATIIPLLVGHVSGDQIQDIAKTLAPFITPKTLLMVSSDFTHYGPRFDYTPFFNDEQAHIYQLDSGALQAIENQSSHRFLSYVQKTGATICGRMPIAILLALLEQKAFGDVEPRLIAYKTSAEITGTPTDSVSYAGLVFTTEKRESLPLDQQLTAYEKSSLLTFSRCVLENIVKKESKENIPHELLYPVLTPALKTENGAFVTLYKNGELRGCIGNITSEKPLYKTIADMTQAAALHDSRFSPVTQEELADITISLSVLTHPHAIASYKDIVLGKHGIILTRGTNSAVFLPKVPTEFQWDLPTTLSQLSKKAGLPADAWKEKDVSYQVFESNDFGERQ